MSHRVAAQRLVEAATEVVEALIPDLAGGSACALVLTGCDARVLRRWAMDSGGCDRSLVSAVAPIHRPGDRLTVGAIELTARAFAPDHFMGAYVREIARHIGRVLGEQHSGAPLRPPSCDRIDEACPHDDELTSVAGTSSQWQGVLRLIQAAARSDLAVSIRGERGTGKLTLARAIHEMRGPEGPFDVIDLERLLDERPSRWLEELTERLTDRAGTVVLRHLNCLSPASTRRLVTTINEHQGGPAQVIANYTLRWNRQTDSGWHPGARPRGLEITVPPLRERPDDIPTIIAAVATRLGRTSQRWSTDALAALKRHPWPENVRELEDVVTSILLCRPQGDILVRDLPDPLLIGAIPGHMTRVEVVEATEIMAALREANGNKVQAAAKLGMSRSTLYRRLRSFGTSSEHLVSLVG